MTIKDVSAATMYDVILDGIYRGSWDPTMVESYDVARLSANADFGYYACKTSGRLDDDDLKKIKKHNPKPILVVQ